MVTILVNTIIVLGSFAMAGWKLGGIEAVSLSILVGTCVDYCIHMMEGYLEADPEHAGLQRNSATGMVTQHGHTDSLRSWRMKHAMATTGIPVIHSAITTGGSALILTTTQLPLFNKFGKIICINTVVSITLTLTFLPALLASFGPLQYHESLRSSLNGVVFLGVFFGCVFLLIYIISQNNDVRGPDGEDMY